MSIVFADTGYWLALVDPHDQLHQEALMLAARYDDREIVTTQMVLVELLAAVTKRGDYQRSSAARYVQRLIDESEIEVVQQTDAQFRQALQRYAARPDQSWSLTDCASFLEMERRGISEALAYDSDFSQAGFSALLRDGLGPGRSQN